MTRSTDPTSCPCSSGLAYPRCCARWHAGPEHLQAPTADALMRSRYVAYVREDTDYLIATWHPSTRPKHPLAFESGLRWLGLEVKRHASVGDTATVAFVARSKLGGRAHRLQETSRFVCEGGRWFYVEGEVGG